MTDSIFLPKLLEFLRFRSVSADSKSRESLLECAKWLIAYLKAIGLETELWPTAGNPVVFAKSRTVKDRPTVLIYGHYDVQPADPLALWNSPPFEPTVKNGIITARGATDNKGQIFAHIAGVQTALEKNGELPVNVLFLIEGEEEIGSVHLAEILREKKDQLRADICVISDTSMVAQGCPTLTYGLRGIAALEISIYGPERDLHSGFFGGAVVNPLTAMAHLLTTLHDEKWRVAIDHFYDDVAQLQDWERKAWASLPCGDAEILKLSGVPQLDGEVGYSTIERLWARPTAELNGFWGGYQGEGSKTVLPSEAHAKLTFRLVPNQKPDRILALAAEHFKKHAPATVRLEVHPGHGGDPYLTDPHSGYGLAAQRALKKVFYGRDPALIREGGSIPILANIKQTLGIDTLLVGLASPDCNMHSPNETFPLENFALGIQLNQELLKEIAAL